MAATTSAMRSLSTPWEPSSATRWLATASKARGEVHEACRADAGLGRAASGDAGQQRPTCPAQAAPMQRDAVDGVVQRLDVPVGKEDLAAVGGAVRVEHAVSAG